MLGVLCAFAARPVEYYYHRSVIFSFTVFFHRAGHRLSDSLNPILTENFKYVCLALSVTAQVSPIALQ